MAIEIEKPLPMQIGDRYLYTLSSYDPVSIEVMVPFITENDIDMAVEGIVLSSGGTKDDINDAWVSEHLEGAAGVAELKEAVRHQLEDLNAHFVEDQKRALCLEELSKRLMQQIPAPELAMMQQNLEQTLEQDLAREGITKEQFAATLENSGSAIDAVIATQAKSICEQGAALDAYVSEKKLDCDESELPVLLRLPEEQANQLIDQAKAAGALDSLKRQALRGKAAEIIAIEAKCTYHHETEEEAKARIERYEKMHSQSPTSEDFKLV